MSTIGSQLTCGQVKRGVIETIQTISKLDNDILISGGISFNSEGKVLISTKTYTDSNGLRFSNCGALQNNLALVVNLLTIYNVYKRRYLRESKGRSVTIFKEEDIQKCISSCEYVTVQSDALSLLMHHVLHIETVEYRGYGEC